MNRLAAHKSGNHDEGFVSGCRVCEERTSFFLRYGESWTPALEAAAIEEAEFDEEVPDDWTEDEEGFLRAPLDLNPEGDPTRNGAFNAW